MKTLHSKLLHKIDLFIFLAEDCFSFDIENGKKIFFGITVGLATIYVLNCLGQGIQRIEHRQLMLCLSKDQLNQQFKLMVEVKNLSCSLIMLCACPNVHSDTPLHEHIRNQEVERKQYKRSILVIARKPTPAKPIK